MGKMTHLSCRCTEYQNEPSTARVFHIYDLCKTEYVQAVRVFSSLFLYLITHKEQLL